MAICPVGAENAPAALPPPPRSTIALRLLAPNHSFWEEYRRGGQRPVQINCLGLPPARLMVNDNYSAAEEPHVNNGAGEEPDVSVSDLDLPLSLSFSTASKSC